MDHRHLPLHLLPFAIASFLGPLTLGRLFDKIGRKPMITATYEAAGALLAAIVIPFSGKPHPYPGNGFSPPERSTSAHRQHFLLGDPLDPHRKACLTPPLPPAKKYPKTA